MLLAQLALPWEEMLQAQIGTLAIVMAIGLIATIGIITAVIGAPVTRLLGRLADTTTAAQAALSNAAAALASAIDTNTHELKVQTAVLTELKTDLRTQIDQTGMRTVTIMTARDQAKAAAANLKAYLDRANPTNAQTVATLKTVIRVVLWLLRNEFKG